jgi:hypothetical protein
VRKTNEVKRILKIFRKRDFQGLERRTSAVVLPEIRTNRVDTTHVGTGQIGRMD